MSSIEIDINDMTEEETEIYERLLKKSEEWFNENFPNDKTERNSVFKNFVIGLNNKYVNEHQYHVSMEDGLHRIYRKKYYIVISYDVKRVNKIINDDGAYVQGAYEILYKNCTSFCLNEEEALTIEYNSKTGTLKYLLLGNKGGGTNSDIFKKLLSLYYNRKTESIPEIMDNALRNSVTKRVGWGAYNKKDFEEMYNIEESESFYKPLFEYMDRRSNALAKEIEENLYSNEHIQKNNELLTHICGKDGELLEKYRGKTHRESRKLFILKDMENNLLYFNFMETFYGLTTVNYLIVYEGTTMKKIAFFEGKTNTISKTSFLSLTTKDISQFAFNSYTNNIHILYDTTNIEGEERSLIEINNLSLIRFFLELGIPLSNIEKLNKAELDINVYDYIMTVVSALKGIIDIKTPQNSLYDLLPGNKEFILMLSRNGVFQNIWTATLLKPLLNLFNKGISIKEIEDALNILYNETNEDMTSREFINALDKIIDIYLEHIHHKSFIAFVNYIVMVRNTEFLHHINAVINMYADTKRFANDLKVELDEFIRPLTIEHNKMAYFYRIESSKIQDNKIVDKARTDLIYEEENYSIIPCLSNKDLITEGSKLNHCVGSYTRRIVNSESSIVFLRKKEDIENPFITIEIKENDIVQIQGNHGKRHKFGKEIAEFMSNWMAKNNLHTRIVVE